MTVGIVPPPRSSSIFNAMAVADGGGIGEPGLCAWAHPASAVPSSVGSRLRRQDELGGAEAEYGAAQRQQGREFEIEADQEQHQDERRARIL